MREFCTSTVKKAAGIIVLVAFFFINAGFGQETRPKLNQLEKAAGEDYTILTNIDGIQEYIKASDLFLAETFQKKDSLCFVVLDSFDPESTDTLCVFYTNIYVADDTLSGNRTVEMDGNWIDWRTGSFAASGETGGNFITGPGTRMYWVPSLAGFRAGQVEGSEWDTIGFASVAFGRNNVALGSYSTSWGRGNRAGDEFAGENATAWGLNTRAEALLATAWGNNTTAGAVGTAWGQDTRATGTRATAWGNNSTATNTGATAWGIDNTAQGLQSTVWGTNNTAANTNSTAWGLDNAALASRSTAWGRDNSVENIGATAWGRGNVVTGGTNSTAFGTNNLAQGTNSTVWGQANTAGGTTVSGEFTTAWGFSNNILGNQSTGWGGNNTIVDTAAAGTVWGNGNTILAPNGTAWGNNNIVEAIRGTVWGMSSKAQGAASTAIGFHVSSTGLGETTIGAYNTEVKPVDTLNIEQLDRLFTVGSGRSNSLRKDAFRIHSGPDLISDNSDSRVYINPGSDIGVPEQNLRVRGDVRIDSLTHSSSQIVGSDGLGRLGSLVVGEGLVISNDSLITTGAGAENIYTSDGIISENRTVTVVDNEIEFETPVGFSIGNDNSFSPAHYSQFSVGEFNENSGFYSITAGLLNTVSGANSLAGGEFVDVEGVSTIAWGTSHSVTGSNTAVFGNNNIINGAGTLAGGTFSRALPPVGSDQTGNPLFQIGDGRIAAERSNAYIIYRGGTIGQQSVAGDSRHFINPYQNDTIPEQTLRVGGDVRIDSLIHSPSQIVGADGSGRLGSLIVGEGLAISNDSLISSGAGAENIYTNDGTLSGNRTVTQNGNWIKFTGGSLLHEGTTGGTPTTGPGSRLMWIPEKRTFAAGTAVGTNWNNLPNYSFNFGNNARTSGLHSVAIGDNVNVTGGQVPSVNLSTIGIGSEISGGNGYNHYFGRGLTFTRRGNSVGVGIWNRDYTFLSNQLGDTYNPNEPVFYVGNGQNSLNRSTALTIYKGGVGNARMHINEGTAPSYPEQTLRVGGDVRIDSLIHSPSQVVGADGSGRLGSLIVGEGLAISNDSLISSGGSGGGLWEQGTGEIFYEDGNVRVGSISEDRTLSVVGDTETLFELRGGPGSVTPRTRFDYIIDGNRRWRWSTFMPEIGSDQGSLLRLDYFRDNNSLENMMFFSRENKIGMFGADGAGIDANLVVGGSAHIENLEETPTKLLGASDENIIGEFVLGSGLTISGDTISCDCAGGGNFIEEVDFTERVAIEPNPWQAAAYGNGVFVAVATSGTNRVARSEDDGRTWDDVQAAAQNSWQDIAYGDGVFVAVSESGTNRVMRSEDFGETWNSVSVPTNVFWTGVTYGDGVFVAVGFALSGSQRIMRSTDNGQTWNTVAAPEQNSYTSVTYGDGVFVAVSADGTNRVARSTDNGQTWTAVAAAEQNSWNEVTYGNGVFVAVATNGTNRVMRSTDNGQTWMSAEAVEQNSWQTVTYGQGVFVAGAINGTSRIMWSTDNGETWTGGQLRNPVVLRASAYGRGNFLFASANDSIALNMYYRKWPVQN